MVTGVVPVLVNVAVRVLLRPSRRLPKSRVAGARLTVAGVPRPTSEVNSSEVAASV